MMREAFCMVLYGTGQGGGAAMLSICGGYVAGGDTEAGVYRGTYTANARTGLFDFDVTVDLPPGMMSVFGQVAPPAGMQIQITCSLPQDPEGGPYTARATFGGTQTPVTMGIARLRDLS